VKCSGETVTKAVDAYLVRHRQNRQSPPSVESFLEDWLVSNGVDLGPEDRTILCGEIYENVEAELMTQSLAKAGQISVEDLRRRVETMPATTPANDVYIKMLDYPVKFRRAGLFERIVTTESKD